MSADLDALFPTPRDAPPFVGVAVGVVTDVADPEHLGRVRLRLPWLAPDTRTDWARVAVAMAGPQRGTWFPLEVDDEVLVAFEHGGAQRPYVLGALWNGVDRPPEDGPDGVRLIRSRSGHTVRLVDTDGAQRIEIADGSGENTITLDTARNAVEIRAATDVTVAARDGTLTLQGNAVTISARTELKVEGGTAGVTADGALTLRGAVVNIN